MSSNKSKKGAMALTMVFLIPIILMLFSVMLDGVLAKSIKNATQRYLDTSTLAVVNKARDNSCKIDNDSVKVGVDLFTQNIANSGMSIEYTLLPMRNTPRDDNGIIIFVITGKITNLVGDMFIPFDYDYQFTLESSALCNSK